MGLLTRLKELVIGVPAHTMQPSTSQLTAQMAAKGQDYIIGRLDPSIRNGFERLATVLTEEIRASQRETVKELTAYLDEKLGKMPANAANTRITKDDVLSKFAERSTITMSQLREALRTSPSAILNHLTRLEEEHLITRVDRGVYRKIADIHVLHGSSEKDEKEKESSEKVEEGLKHLFENSPNVRENH